MPHIASTLEFTQRTTERVWQMMRRIYEQLAIVINGNISFGSTVGLVVGGAPTFKSSDNINGVWAFVTTPATANTDFTITHNLGRNLSGYIVMQKTASVDIYTSPTVNANPTTQLILRATVINVTVGFFLV